MNQPKPTATALARLSTILEPSFPLRLLGFGLIYVWGSCLWETSIFSPIHASASSGGIFSIWLLSACLTPIACIVCAFAGRKRELTDHSALFFLGPLLAVVGTICVALYPSSPEILQVPLAIVAGLGTGVGPAVMIVLWVALYANLNIEVIETAVPASFLLIIACMFVIPCISAPIAIPIAILLPIASGALLALSYKYVIPEKQQSNLASEPMQPTQNVTDSSGVKPKDYPIASMFRTFLLILVTYAISCMVSFLPQSIAPFLPEATAAIIGMLFAVALSIAIVRFSTRIDLEVYFRWMSTPLILSVIFAAFPNSISVALSSILTNAMFTSLEIIMILYFIRLAKKMKCPASFFIGIGSCATYTGVLIGYLLGIGWSTGSPTESIDTQTVCLLLIGVFAVAMPLVPRKDTAWTGGSLPDPLSPPTPPSVNNDLPNNPQIAFGKICDEVAQLHKLSARETEIFKLMAQGRSQPYIRDVLYLSKNTVSTHVKHLYRKLDIHSKEELIDLVSEQGSGK